MFERFSRDARAAVVEAQAVAQEAGSRSIDTRHVLVALCQTSRPARVALSAVGVDPDTLARTVREDVAAGGLDAQALASLGIDLDAVRERADAVFGTGALSRAFRRTRKGWASFTSDAKKALELALRETIRLQASTIDGGHLLLGLLRGAGSPGEAALRRALEAAGSSVAALRSAVEHPQAEAS